MWDFAARSWIGNMFRSTPRNLHSTPIESNTILRHKDYSARRHLIRRDNWMEEAEEERPSWLR